MDRLLFKPGELRSFLEQAQSRLGIISSDELAKLVELSGRTIRDWKREKFKPTKDHIIKLSELSKVKIPDYDTLPPYWNIRRAAHLGGKRRYELYGVVGTKEDRSKAGKASWEKRKNNPELWIKYTKNILKPKESVDLAEFIGIMLGDGGLTPFQCSVYLNSDTDQEFAYYVRDLIYKLFGVIPKIYVHRKHKVWRVSVSSVNLVKYLTLKGLSIGNKVRLQVDVPEWIRSHPDYIKACIRGLIDTDGTFIIHKYRVGGKKYFYPKMTFSNRSQPLLDFVYLGLKGIGFNPKKTYRYEVWLHNQNEVSKYLERVGTNNYRPNIKKILEEGPDGKVAVC